MAKLSTKKRDKLARSDFGLPGRRAYPMPDASHARNALARASQERHEGRLSSGQYRKIVSKAHRVLHGRAARRTSRA